MTDAVKKQDKRYNIIGTVANAVVRQDRNQQNYVTFDLVKGEDVTKCVAFADKCDAFTAAFKDGDEVKLYGFYEKRSFQTASGEQKDSQRFRVLWSAKPSARKDEAGEAPAQEAAAS